MPRESECAEWKFFISQHLSLDSPKIHNPSLTFILMKKASKRNDVKGKNANVYDEEGRQALILSITIFYILNSDWDGIFYWVEFVF